MSRCALPFPRSPGRRTTALVCFVLAALTFLIFAQALRFGFVALDDNLFVDRNPALEAGLSWRGLSWAFTANLTHLDGRAEYWEPLTLVTRLADYQFFGFAPWGHHLTSLLIHLATGLALFGALRQLTSAFWRSALVAALFLVHPMHVEPVVWLSARKDLVSGLFYVLTIWAYGWFVAGQSRRRYAVFFAAFSLPTWPNRWRSRCRLCCCCWIFGRYAGCASTIRTGDVRLLRCAREAAALRDLARRQRARVCRAEGYRGRGRRWFSPDVLAHRGCDRLHRNRIC
jgi:hypothetical protein